MESQSENKITKFLANLSNYLLGLTILCYISGFAITNLYLGSLGIVNLDILRSRYLLTGMLFIIFIGTIGFLLYGLWNTLREYKEKPPVETLWKAFWYSFQNIAILYYLIPALATFAGTSNTISPIVPQANSNIEWEQWLNTAPIGAFRLTASFLGFIAIAFALLIIVAIIVNPKDKDGVKTSRKEKLSQLIKVLKENSKNILSYTVIFFLLLYALIIFGSILIPLQSSNVNSNRTMISYFQAGWSRYFNGIIILYGIIASFLLFIFFTIRNATNEKKEDSEDKNPTTNYFAWAYFVALLIGIIIPTYGFGIYPYLPQQIGGGRLIPIEIRASSNDLNSVFVTPNHEIYLIDRAPNNSLFMIVDKPTGKYKILEISNDLIESIVFYKSP